MKAPKSHQVQNHQHTGFTLRPLAAILVSGWPSAQAMTGQQENYRSQTVLRMQQLQRHYMEKHSATCITNLGEGMTAAFPSAWQAVKCANAIQAGVEKLLSEQLSIGIHLGEVTYVDQDVLGNTLTVASALQEMALPGQILMSEVMALNSLAENELIGTHQLEGIRTPVNIFQATAKEASSQLQVYVRDHGSRTIRLPENVVRHSMS